jgi:hypothetical protein
MTNKKWYVRVDRNPIRLSCKVPSVDLDGVKINLKE